MVLLNGDNFSERFLVRPLTGGDVSAMLKRYETNPAYVKHCPPVATEALILSDLAKLPHGMSLFDNHFVGYFDKGKLVAVLDLLEGYPSEETAFIGLFILDKAYQGRDLAVG